MRKIVIKGYGYTTQTSDELNELLEKGLEITGGIGNAIDEYIEGADEVLEGNSKVTLEPDTEYFVKDDFMWECTEEGFKKYIAEQEAFFAERARLSQ